MTALPAIGSGPRSRPPLTGPELVAHDRRHVWHPYAGTLGDAPLFPVTSAEGVRLRLADGRELIDGMASWWAAIHGYNHPVLNEAAHRQIDAMAHVMFGGLTHAPAVELALRLTEITPEPLTRVFLADSGSVAVEVALKMALQYQRGRGRPERSRLLTVRGGYHGDTFGAMAVCDPVGGMHHMFSGVLPGHLFAPVPPGGFDRPLRPEDTAELEALLAGHAGEVAAVVMEPVVQGAGGMRFHSPAYVRRVRELCDEHDVLLVLDEIATGFGRTGGELFAAGHAGVAPDIMCVGKALTGGYLTMAATLCTDEVAGVISRGEGGAFMHGPTFMGNPLAASIACASVDLLLSGPWREEVARVGAGLRTGLEPARALPGVADVRVLGAIGVIELERPVDMARVQPAFVERGVWVRPFGRLVYVMPPYVTNDADVATLTAAMVDVVANVHGG